MLQLYQNRYDETDPSSAEAREACFSPQEMRGPADINRVVVPIVDQQDARRSHATESIQSMQSIQSIQYSSPGCSSFNLIGGFIYDNRQPNRGANLTTKHIQPSEPSNRVKFLAEGNKAIAISNLFLEINTKFLF